MRDNSIMFINVSFNTSDSIINDVWSRLYDSYTGCTQTSKEH